MIDEGYVKYQCKWISAPPIAEEKLIEINSWRNRLYQLKLIGQYNNGIGFGNISIRNCALHTAVGSRGKEFIVSGTSTGNLPRLNPEHYTTVIDFDWDKNFVSCVGPIQASSESLTHAAIYEANPHINAVIHVHDRDLWENLLDLVPTTARDCAYGTPEMAKEIIRLCQQDDLRSSKILVMSGHEEGIITFGHSLDEAGEVLMKYYQLDKKKK